MGPTKEDYTEGAVFGWKLLLVPEIGVSVTFKFLVTHRWQCNTLRSEKR